MTQTRNAFFPQLTNPVDLYLRPAAFLMVYATMALDPLSHPDALFAVCGMVTLAATGCALYNIAKHTDTFSMA